MLEANSNWIALIPLIITGSAAVALMVLGAFARLWAQRWAYGLAQLVVLLSLGVTVAGGSEARVLRLFNDMLYLDWIALLLLIFIHLSVFAMLVYGRFYLLARRLERAEFYALVLLCLLGMQALVTAGHLLVFYLGLELMSLALYALVAWERDEALRAEAAVKYFVLGALASGFILYGMSFLYGVSGSLLLHDLAAVASLKPFDDQLFGFGIIFLIAGIAFKFGVAPFHMWVADVYQGAPTPVTLLISSAPKLAAFALAFRLLVLGFFEYAHLWQPILLALGLISLVVGNLAALRQTNLKRMLAYSGVAHMGFVLLGLAAGVVDGDPRLALNAYSATLFYAISYAIMSLAAFGLIILFTRHGFEADDLYDFKGLNRTHPWYALLVLITMMSLAGIPFFLGFFAKLAVLQALVSAGQLWAAVVAVVMSLVGAFYYLRVVKVVYFDEPLEERRSLVAAAESRVLLSLNALALALLGLLPQGLMSLTAYAMIVSL